MFFDTSAWMICIRDRSTEHRFPGRKNCDSLESLCEITALRNLSISSLQREHLPSRMSALVNLRCLKIDFPRLKTLQPELRQLRKLQYFCLNGCKSFSKLPSWTDSLSQLANLSLARCSELTSLRNLYKHQNLRILDISHCYNLRELPDGFTEKGSFPTLQVNY